AAGRIFRNRSAYAGAGTGRLYSSWTTTNQSADAELYSDLKTLRARSRELERNNDYARKFLKIVGKNVVGANGVTLQMRVKNKNGEPDNVANSIIEQGWKEWCAKGNCDVSGTLAMHDIQRLIVTHMARDGEILVRRVRSSAFPFGYALQLIEADHLDERYNDTLPNGNKIKMGIEIDPWGKPVAYHLFKNHPGDTMFADYQYGERERIPADEILHLFLRERVSQSRGLPWMHAAMTRMNMQGGYEEAELVAARTGAAKMGFYYNSTSSQYAGDDTEDGSPVDDEATPGSFRVLPEGWQFQPYDPTHPTTAYRDFVKAISRGIASGLDVSYESLANDRENVNYSSIRAGLLDERDTWRMLHAWMVEHFLRPVFAEWLEMALLTQAVRLPFSGYQKFNAPYFMPRGFQWVDPKAEMIANSLAISAGLDTASNIAAQRGMDIEEIYQQLAREKALREKYGITTTDDAKIAKLIMEAEGAQA
ncbi:MAG: phage portal protein, partial [Candidatus Zixiibacteriota bacterium]